MFSSKWIMNNTRPIIYKWLKNIRISIKSIQVTVPLFYKKKKKVAVNMTTCYFAAPSNTSGIWKINWKIYK